MVILDPCNNKYKQVKKAHSMSVLNSRFLQRIMIQSNQFYNIKNNLKVIR